MATPNEYLAAREAAQDDSLPLAGTVLVREVSQYGVWVLQPANKLARAVLTLTGRKTITATDTGALKAMGFTVQTTGESPRRL
jgi:hypothetical protein